MPSLALGRAKSHPHSGNPVLQIRKVKFKEGKLAWEVEL